jgi:putative ABC transport system permease protein
MIRFLLKGLIRDKSRSRTPIIVVSIGVMLTVFMHAFINGFMGDTIEMNANFTHGHLKVMTQAYAENRHQIPNDLAILEADELIAKLQQEYPEIKWVPRIQFGALVDVPDENGETASQSPANGIAMDLLSGKSEENKRLKIESAIRRGRLIEKPGEVLLSEEFSQQLQLNIGDELTLIGTTMYGSMSFYQLKLAGTISFGSEAIDRGTMIIDIEDARQAFDMQNASGEILGFMKSGFYKNDEAIAIAKSFNAKYQDKEDEFSPLMLSLSQQGSMGQYVELTEVWTLYISLIFIIAMAIVLWNVALLGSLRRYGEFGVRLAMGEEKNHVFATLIYESIAVGIVGTLIGTAFGLAFAFVLQEYGMDISGMMEGASIMMPTVIRARISISDFYIGFFPGLVATLIGTMLAGRGIYKRKTSQLFKELEA